MLQQSLQEEKSQLKFLWGERKKKNNKNLFFYDGNTISFALQKDLSNLQKFCAAVI